LGIAAGMAALHLLARGSPNHRVRLSDAESRSDAILDAAVDGIITIDERGRIETFNRAAEYIFGYAAADVVGKNVKVLMPEPYTSEHDGYLRNYLKTGVPRIIGIGREVTGRRKDGSTFPMDLAVGESRIGSRPIFAGIIRDITDRKATEARLRDSECRNRAIVEAAADGIITIDERGLIQSVNGAAERIFGYDMAEMQGRNVKMLMPEPYESSHDEYLHNYRATGHRRIIGIGREVTGRRKDGSTFPMDLAVGEATFPGGRVFAGIIRDISDRKQVEERLRASEEHFRCLIEGVRDYAITMLDNDGNIVSWNVGAERLYGWSADEVIGGALSRFYPLEAIAHGDHERAMEIASQEGRYEEEGWRLRKDGSRFWAHEVIAVMRDDANRRRGFTRVSRDMTESKRHEDDLKHAKEEADKAREASDRARLDAERANMAKTKFLAAASHDLRQPVQAIFFFTSVLSHKLKGHAAQSILEDLQSSLDGLNILLDSLLDVSRLDAGLVTPKEAGFSVGAILDRMAVEFLPLARDKGISLRTVSSSAVIRSDPALLSRVVQNLVANAIRYTARGRVLLGCRRRQGELRIEVWDTGIGIPQDRLGEIFEEFTQLGNPERDRTQGLGLGLAIVDRLARLLGHRVEVQSVPGRGSRFTITVPLSTPPIGIPASRRRHAAPIEGNRLVVIIDDEAIVLKGLAMVLQNWGYEVVAASSEAEAILKLSTLSHEPSLVLADYRLREGKTGTQAVASIRDLYKSAIPSIIITGDSAPERLREAEASGLSILHKPVQPPELKVAVREALERSAAFSRLN
jgi:PAS domain S-box-containing protein